MNPGKRLLNTLIGILLFSFASQAQDTSGFRRQCFIGAVTHIGFAPRYDLPRENYSESLPLGVMGGFQFTPRTRLSAGVLWAKSHMTFTETFNAAANPDGRQWLYAEGYRKSENSSRWTEVPVVLSFYAGKPHHRLRAYFQLGLTHELGRSTSMTTASIPAWEMVEVENVYRQNWTYGSLLLGAGVQATLAKRCEFYLCPSFKGFITDYQLHIFEPGPGIFSETWLGVQAGVDLRVY